MKKIDFEAHYYIPEIFTALEKTGCGIRKAKS